MSHGYGNPLRQYDEVRSDDRYRPMDEPWQFVDTRPSSVHIEIATQILAASTSVRAGPFQHSVMPSWLE